MGGCSIPWDCPTLCRVLVFSVSANSISVGMHVTATSTPHILKHAPGMCYCPLSCHGEGSPPSTPMMKRPRMSISKAPAWREQAISNRAETANPLLTSKVNFLEEKEGFDEAATGLCIPRTGSRPPPDPHCHLWPYDPEQGTSFLWVHYHG